MGFANRERGAAAIFVVAFFTLLITVITLSFANLVLQDQEQALNNDLGSSAYDAAATSAPEDAIRVLKWYGKNCIGAARQATIDADCAKIEQGNRCNIQNLSDANRENILPGVEFVNGEVILASDPYDEAYSCLTLATVTDDVKLRLTEAKSDNLIPLKTLANQPFDTIDLSWFLVGPGKDIPNGSATLNNAATPADATLPQSNAGGGTPSWSSTTPPIIRFEIIPVDKNSINIDAVESRTRTVFLYPSSNAPAGPIDLLASDVRYGQKSSAPRPVRCNASAADGQYVCNVRLNTLPGDANSQYFVRMTSLYGDTLAKIRLLNGGSSVQFDNVSPKIHAVGRANDIYRAIETRVMTVMPDSPIKDGGFDITQGACKDFYVPSYYNYCPDALRTSQVTGGFEGDPDPTPDPDPDPDPPSDPTPNIDCASDLIFCDDFEKYAAKKASGAVKAGDLKGTPFFPDWEANQSCPDRAFVENDPVAGRTGQSLRMTVYPGDHTLKDGSGKTIKNPACPAAPNENPRSQFLSKAIFGEGDDYYISVGTYFPSNFPRSIGLSKSEGGRGSYLQITQLYGGPSKCGPPIGIFVVGDRFHLNQVNGADNTNDCTGVKRTSGVWKSNTPIVYGTSWNKIIMHIKFSADPTKGYIEIWLNGVKQKFSKVKNNQGKEVTLGENDERYYTAALVAGINYNPGGKTKLHVNQYRGASEWTTGPLTLWHDDIKVGRTYQSVQ